MDKLIYNYHPTTGAYISSSVADLSPLEPDTCLIPAHATEIAPPAATPNTCAVFDAIAGAWSLVPDYRGAVLYSTTTGARVEVTELGKTPVDLGLTDQAPPAGPVMYVAGAWQVDIPTAKAAKNAEINAARAAANAGTFAHGGKTFACDALSRGDIDGVNGYVALFGALPPEFPGAWKAADNSYLPIADVPAWKAFYAAMVAQGAANFAHAQALKAQLAAATTPEAVAAIAW